MKHTIKNPLVLKHRESVGYVTNKRSYETQELVSKEAAEELLEALKKVEYYITCPGAYEGADDLKKILKQAIKNAESC